MLSLILIMANWVDVCIDVTGNEIDLKNLADHINEWTSWHSKEVIANWVGNVFSSVGILKLKEIAAEDWKYRSFVDDAFYEDWEHKLKIFLHSANASLIEPWFRLVEQEVEGAELTYTAICEGELYETNLPYYKGKVVYWWVDAKDKAHYQEKCTVNAARKKLLKRSGIPDTGQSLEQLSKLAPDKRGWCGVIPWKYTGAEVSK